MEVTGRSQVGRGHTRSQITVREGVDPPNLEFGMRGTVQHTHGTQERYLAKICVCFTFESDFTHVQYI